MRYFGVRGSPPLDAFVDDIYCLTGAPRHRRMNVPPMPSAHLFINLGEPIRLVDSDAAVPPATFADAWFMGLWTRRFIIEFPAAVRLVGVHFKPWGISPFIRTPASELRDRWLPAEAMWDRSLDRMRGQLADATSTGELLRIVDEELRSRLAATPPRGLDLVARSTRRLEASWGGVMVGTLSESAGVSPNHLANQFTSHLGVTPKRIGRIYRFARLILSVDAQRSVDWAELAHSAGYFDQSHFSKEFKDFTGHTPTEYLALRRRHPAQRGFPLDAGPMPAE